MKQKRKKIVYLLQSSGYSGAENVVCQIISFFKDKYECIYCSPEGSIRTYLEDANIHYKPLKNFSIREIDRAIREEKPDVIHAHDMHACFKAALVCGKIRLICHIHNNKFDARNFSIKSILFRIAANKAFHIFWVSDSCMDSYRYITAYRKKSSVLYNIIEVDKLKNEIECDKNEYDYDIIYLGRLSYQKNPQRMIKILSKLCKINSMISVAVVGDGELKDECIKLAKDSNISNNITFYGFVKNPYKILKSSKVMLMTSRWEGLPMSVLEAMALGVPVVSTYVDGVSKVIDIGNTGYLTDNDDEFVRYVLKIINNKSEYDRLSENCILVSEDHNNSNKYISAIDVVY